MNNSSIKIQLIEDEHIWCSILQRFIEFDVYHTHEYALVSELESAQVYLLHFQFHELEFIFPLVKREIVLNNRQYFDFGSVYGYPGPIFKGAWGFDDLKEAWGVVSDFLGAQSIVCLVSRLNPFCYTDPNLDLIGEVRAISSIVAIDLELSEEQQVSEYRSNHRRDLRKLAKQGVTCRKVNAGQYLDAFIEMYNGTMDRLGAARGYYFSKDYYNKLFSANSFTTELYLCFDEADVPVCGGIFFSTGCIMHYHLGATAESHLRLAPTKMLFDTVRRESALSGYKKLNLGGGLGGQDDNLFRFKAGFSKSTFRYEMFTCKFDGAVYDQLLDQRRAEAAASGGVLQQNFYPEYRAPIISDNVED